MESCQMTQKTKKPRKKKQADLPDKIMAVDEQTLDATSTHVQKYQITSPKDLLPHALHKQIAELKARIENLETIIDCLKNKK